MKHLGKIFLYGAFALLMGIIFLFYRFPSDLAKQMIDTQLTQINPYIQVQTRSVAPIFPPGIKLEPLSVTYSGLPIFNTDDMRVRPDLFTIFGSQKSFSFNGSIENGQIKGNADLRSEANRAYAKVVFNLIAIPLEALELSNQWPEYRPSGDINAYVDYDSRKGSGGTAKINLDIVPVKIALDPPLMGIEQVDFNQLKAEITITQRMLQLRRCEAEGPQFEGKISGSIIFREPMSDSRLTLSCTLRPQPDFVAEHKNDMIGGLLSSGNTLKRGMVFRISGTLANPQYVIR